MASHEQSFADEFNAFMRTKAQSHGMRVHAFSLDGQDRDAGADYVITDSSRFALVEFKYTEAALVSEAHKPRRLKLCQQLGLAPDMRELHDRCHFIAWAQRPELAVRVNVYRNEICTAQVFGAALGPQLQQAASIRVKAGTFADDFLGNTGSRNLSLKQFDRYVQWVLTETSGATTSTLELITSNIDSGDLFLVRLPSLAAAQSWLKQHWPQPPAPSHRFRP